MTPVAVWSVITMLQDESVEIDLNKKESETKRIADFLMVHLSITSNCACMSAQRAFDAMASAVRKGSAKESEG